MRLWSFYAFAHPDALRAMQRDMDHIAAGGPIHYLFRS